MKKILLIVAVVLCLAVAGTALAVKYNDAQSKSGTVVADTCLELSLGDTADNVNFALEKGIPQIYTIICNVARSSAAAGDGELVITVTESAANSLGDVDITLCSDANGQNALTGANVSTTGTKDDAERTFTVTGLAPGTYTYYLSIGVPLNISDDNLAAVSGTIDVSLDVA